MLRQLPTMRSTGIVLLTLVTLAILIGVDADRDERGDAGHGQTVNSLRQVFRRSSKSNSIAFHAYLSSHKANLQTGHILKFDKILTNKGNGYHGHTGVFIAPRSGLYQFIWTALVYGHKHLHLCLKVNGTCMSWTYSNAPKGASEPQTGSVILELKRNDHVSVVNNSNGGYAYKEYTSFSGLRVGA